MAKKKMTKAERAEWNAGRRLLPGRAASAVEERLEAGGIVERPDHRES